MTTCLCYELTFRNSKTQIHMMLIWNTWQFVKTPDPFQVTRSR